MKAIKKYSIILSTFFFTVFFAVFFTAAAQAEEIFRDVDHIGCATVTTGLSDPDVTDYQPILGSPGPTGFFQMPKDYDTTTPQLVQEAAKLAHSYAKEKGQDFYYSYPGFFIQDSTVKFNRNAEKEGENAGKAKGYYIHLKHINPERLSRNDKFEFKFLYVRSSLEGQLKNRLLKVQVRNAASGPFTTYKTCEGFVAPAVQKVVGSEGERKMRLVARVADDYGYFQPADLPTGMESESLDMTEGGIASNPEAKKLWDKVEADAKESYQEYVRDVDPEYRDDYPMDLEKYIGLEQVEMVKDGGKVIGYAVRLSDIGYANIIQDGAWMTLYIAIKADGSLVIVARVEETA